MKSHCVALEGLRWVWQAYGHHRTGGTALEQQRTVAMAAAAAAAAAVVVDKIVAVVVVDGPLSGNRNAVTLPVALTLRHEVP